MQTRKKARNGKIQMRSREWQGKQIKNTNIGHGPTICLASAPNVYELIYAHSDRAIGWTCAMLVGMKGEKKNKHQQQHSWFLQYSTVDAFWRAYIGWASGRNQW